MSTSAIHDITPDFCPRPIACGTFQDDLYSHFYICKFYDLSPGVPEPVAFCKKLARLHSHHASPGGRFGFACTTYNGDLPQDNTWSDSWEAFFANGLRHVLNVREERAGQNTELELILPALFEKVIPRLLRPLETDGRVITPSLVHGDLWCGNTGIIDEDTEEGIVYDPASFWAHNECTSSVTNCLRCLAHMTNRVIVQMNWETGGRREISSLVPTSRHIIPIFRKLSHRRTMRIEMRSMRCESSLISIPFI
jgi:fructosamine-3-kinase